jgi:hypothetical protein
MSDMENPPWNAPRPYSPLQNMLPPSLAGIDPLMQMLVNPYLQQFAGPTDFLPYQGMGQGVADQFMMRNYQQQTLAHTLNTQNMGTPQVATNLLGLRALITNKPITELNRQEADSFAGMVNNPFAKMALRSFNGPENLEGVMFGRRRPGGY